jgi:predicted nucleic acid-binding protein
MIINVETDYLIGYLEEIGMIEEDIFKLLDRLKGFRIYVSKKTVEQYQLKKRYLELKKQLPKSEIVKILANEFDKSKSRIRKYIRDFEKATTKATF